MPVYLNRSKGFENLATSENGNAHVRNLCTAEQFDL